MPRATIPRMKTLVVANWKMSPATSREAKKLFEATKKIAETCKKVSLVVAPPTIFLRELAVSYRGRSLSFAAQHAHPDSGKAFTGETSLAQVRDAKAAYLIVGHAERRAMGETNDDTAKKTAAALALGMTPILCIGEKQRTVSGDYFLEVKEQLRAGLAEVPVKKHGKVIIAYEPVWAIGGSSGMVPRDMHEMSIFIRKSMVELYGAEGLNVRILYGGSVDETNARAMLEGGDISGFLVGRASTDADKFEVLIHAISYPSS